MTRITWTRRILSLLVLGIAAVAGTAPWAGEAPGARPPLLSLDANEPIAVNADSFVADLNGETGTYTGNVIVSQGAVKLHADEVRVVSPGGRAARMEARGHVVVDSPSGQAIGDVAIYDVRERLIRLTGNVVLTKDANVMRGSALEVSMATGLARLTGAASALAPGAPADPRGRVQGLFAPAPRPATPGASAPRTENP